MPRSLLSALFTLDIDLDLFVEQNIIYLTVNLPDVVESTLQCDLTPTSLKFKAKAGKYVPKASLRDGSLTDMLTR
jgi:hypothetical protein